MMHLIRYAGVLGLVCAATLSAQQPTQTQGGFPQQPLAQSVQQQRAGLPNAANPQLASAPQQPAAPVTQPFPPLNAEQQNRLDTLLAAWESSSSQTERLQCKFTRWQYRTFQAPQDTHATWATGELKYVAPAQGLYKVEQMAVYAGLDEQKQPKYKEDPAGDWWVCTGKELRQFDRLNKQLEVFALPEKMQGQQIVSSPLPFVFNLKAAEMKQRYWIRELPPKADGEFWLEAHPKRQEDRAQFAKVMIVVTREQFLPRALIMFPPNFDARTSPDRDVYEFSEVKRNDRSLWSRLFDKPFYEADPPSKDWKIIRKAWTEPQIAGNPAAPQQQGQQQNPAPLQR